MKTGRIVFQGGLLAVLAAAVFGSTLAIRQRDYTFFDPLVDVHHLLSQRYVDAPDQERMQRAALEGMIESVGDPYTLYVPPEAGATFDKDLTGDYVGIGAQVELRDGWLTIVTPLEDSPAFRAGIMAGDRVVEIEGQTTASLSIDDCIGRLTGEPGTSVSIVVERAGQRVPITVRRERIIARTIKGVRWIPGEGDAGHWDHTLDPARSIYYIRLTQFTPSTAREFIEALDAVGADRPGAVGGLILDVRWNPGGVMQAALFIADLFVRDGVLLSTRGRAHPEEVIRATADNTLPDFPIAVVINGGSASASEIVAGALVENDRAIAVGTRTFGKGLVQAVHALPHPPGAQLKITEQRYYLPSGRSIQRSDDSLVWGVDPNPGFYVPLTNQQIARLLEVRRDQSAIRAAPNGNRATTADPDWIESTMRDPQLAAALRALQQRIDTGEWTPTGQPLPDTRAQATGSLADANLLRERLLRELTRVERQIDALSGATGGDVAPSIDLWPDATTVEGGRVLVYDRDGNLVRRLRITGEDLERWLIDADVQPIDGPDDSGP